MSREARLPLFRERIVPVLRHAFPECSLFDNGNFINELFSASMHFLEAGQVEHLNLFADKYHTYASVKEKPIVRLVFAACCVLITSRQERSLAIRQETPDVPAMLHTWRTANTKDFNHITYDEISLLVNFRRTIRIALLIVAPNLNKLTMINIACRLQATPEIYSIGSGKCAALRRRVTIYELESGVKEEHRPYRAVGMTKAEYYHQLALISSQGDPTRGAPCAEGTLHSFKGQHMQPHVEPARVASAAGGDSSTDFTAVRQPHLPVNTGLVHENTHTGAVPTFSEDMLNFILASTPTRDYDYTQATNESSMLAMFDAARLPPPPEPSNLSEMPAVPSNNFFTQSIYEPIPAVVGSSGAAAVPFLVQSPLQTNTDSAVGLTYSDQVRLQEYLSPSHTDQFQF
eukprot:gene12547-14511_t